MSLPKQVQQQLDAATAFESQLAAQIEQATQPAQSVSALMPPDPPPSEPPVLKVAPPAPPEPPKADFEHKYRVLQGMYEADVKQVKRTQQELAAEIAALKHAPATTAPQPDAKDIETFGADLIAMVQRYAEGQQAGTEARLVALEQKVGVVAEQATGNAKRSFFQELERLVPDYRGINADDRWLAWLGEQDAMFGFTRQAALDDAQAKGDVARLAGFFTAFKNSLPAAPEPDVALTHQITPTGAGSPPPPRDLPKPRIAQKAITDFYNDVAKGKYAGREDVMNQLELQINLAVAEGRVT